MFKVTVKARAVGDSIVMTLPKSVLKLTGIREGDSLLIQIGPANFILVRKEDDKVARLMEAQKELDILRKKLDVINTETTLASWEHNNSMPTLHPGVEDPHIMEGFVKDMNFKRSKLQLKIAQKELDIYRMGG